MFMNVMKQILKITNDNLEEDIIIYEHQIEDDLSQYKLNSISFIKIIVAIEETFEVEIPDEYLLFSEMNTIAKMVDVVNLEIQKNAK